MEVGRKREREEEREGKREREKGKEGEREMERERSSALWHSFSPTLAKRKPKTRRFIQVSLVSARTPVAICCCISQVY